jgi:phosphatidylglycerophosphate synthase
LRYHITPNTVTFLSLILGIITGISFALNHIWLGFFFGLSMGFFDIVDGQMAKDFGGTTRFGAVLDSTVDRLNEFFAFAGYSIRYYFLGQQLFIAVCAVAFLGSIMISYVKARAEAEGFTCKVGRLQRPERLTLLAIGTLIACLGFDIGIDIVILFLAIATQVTVIYRIVYVYRQSKSRQK